MSDTRLGIAVHYNWGDQDVIEVTIRAANGAFCGTVNAYVEPGGLSAMAMELADIPGDLSDKRSVTLGAFGPTYAGGGVTMSFKCTDRSGHAVAEIMMESEDKGQTVTLTVPVVPSALDEFVRGLAKIESTHGRAVLPTGT